ncbi:MlaE family ABC transporter permease [Mycolicibacterium pyrenivorans]|uniref:MlaE family ABC transporter permease n=1 Tax=Mycolicibacterium pyrenivorans TaxID=187102 RepID=UPI00355719E0
MDSSRRSTSRPSQYFFARLASARPLRKPLRTTGQWAVFIGQVIWTLPLTISKYGRETLRAMNSLAWGRGSLIVDGGVISVLIILGVALGASIAVESFAILDIIGFGAMSGIVAGIGLVREIGPLVAGIAFTAQPGARMTAEIGAMRINDEIDAVESMGLRPIPFVVGTRLVGGMLSVIPGYALTLIASFWVMEMVIQNFHNQPGGTYAHYLLEFTTSTDLLYSCIKASAFCMAATFIHCYYGYFVSGGPVGVGVASGRAVRASLVTIMVLDFIFTVALWGLQPDFVFKG